jgi:uncharacterized phage-associated protein
LLAERCRIVLEGFPMPSVSLLARFRTRFDERKTAAAAAVLLREAGGRMEYIRLLKLLYLADRESWLRFNRPITGDRYVAMKYGPVLSATLDLIKAEHEVGEELGPWARTIEREDYAVRLMRAEPDLGPLSDAEIELLVDAYRFHETYGKWRLVDFTHALPEWSDPGGSSREILPEDILAALGKSPEEIEDARRAAAEDAYLERLLSGESR